MPPKNAKRASRAGAGRKATNDRSNAGQGSSRTAPLPNFAAEEFGLRSSNRKKAVITYEENPEVRYRTPRYVVHSETGSPAHGKTPIGELLLKRSRLPAREFEAS
jgi:hypothetical protein